MFVELGFGQLLRQRNPVFRFFLKPHIQHHTVQIGSRGTALGAGQVDRLASDGGEGVDSVRIPVSVARVLGASGGNIGGNTRFFLP
jgi:hypothetical protein